MSPENIKKCPYCSEEIQIDAIKCKHCKEFLKNKDKRNTYLQPFSFKKTIITGMLVGGLLWNIIFIISGSNINADSWLKTIVFGVLTGGCSSLFLEKFYKKILSSILIASAFGFAGGSILMAILKEEGNVFLMALVGGVIGLIIGGITGITVYIQNKDS